MFQVFLQNTTRLFALLRHQPKRQKLYLFLGVVASFCFSLLVILTSNPFFSGDMGIIGLITHDYQSGQFFSWYFYGQTYFGNLENIALAILTLPTGITIKSLYFWEHFFYAVSVFLLLKNIPKLRFWEMSTYPAILFFAIRFYQYTYVPQGFAFVTLITVFLFDTINWWWNRSAKTAQTAFIVGIFSTLSLWHYPLYIVAGPIFVVLYLWKLKLRKITFSFLHPLFILIGFIIGIPPLIFATHEKNFANLSHFSGGGDNPISRFFDSAVHYSRDYFMYFLDPGGLNESTPLKLVISQFLTPRNLWGLTVLTAFTLVFLYSIRWWKEHVVAYIFFAVITALVAYRGIPGNSDYLFGTMRYSVQVYVLMYYLVIHTSHSLFYQKRNSFLLPLTSLQRVVNHAGRYIILCLLLFTISNSTTLLLHGHRGAQSYETALQDIQNSSRKYVYCQDYFQMCATLAFLTKDSDITVQIIDIQHSGSSRNPSTDKKVDQAVANGEKVLSLIQPYQLSDEDMVIGSYKSDTYFLVEGVFANYR